MLATCVASSRGRRPDSANIPGNFEGASRVSLSGFFVRRFAARL